MNNAIFAADEFAISGVVFVYIGQVINAPPAAVAAVRVKVEPAAIGGSFVLISAFAVVVAIAVEIDAVAACVVENAV